MRRPVGERALSSSASWSSSPSSPSAHSKAKPARATSSAIMLSSNKPKTSARPSVVKGDIAGRPFSEAEIFFARFDADSTEQTKGRVLFNPVDLLELAPRRRRLRRRRPHRRHPPPRRRLPATAERTTRLLLNTSDTETRQRRLELAENSKCQSLPSSIPLCELRASVLNLISTGDHHEKTCSSNRHGLRNSPRHQRARSSGPISKKASRASTSRRSSTPATSPRASRPKSATGPSPTTAKTKRSGKSAAATPSSPSAPPARP